ncbi:MAG: choice-of-anchor D domain-containing protein [Candidatus Kapabacteria bacterium]|jgi:hypothetical protein|nr:choice-of-anchor D domain-containing protein [Candidatus Kapabacteria bacterium]
MKSKFLPILAALLLSALLMLPQNAFAQKKYYVIFDNFEDQIGNDGVEITNLFDLCYWDHLREHMTLGRYAEKKPFSVASLAQRDVTEYDVAIFVLGTQHHLGSMMDGIKVLDKVKQMLAANKGVIIIGSNVIPAAFAGDNEAKAWLEEWLGVTEPSVLSLVHGGTRYGFRADGVEGDPISRGYKKQCNREYSENIPVLRGPVRYYNSISFFKVDGGKNAVAFDYIKEALDQDVNEGWVTGVRAEYGRARVALWTTNFDIASTYHTHHFYNSMTWAINWMTRDVPHPEGFLAAEDETIDFGIIDPNQHGYMTAVLQNNGREKFDISSFNIAGDEPEGSFRIMEGGEPITMMPGDIHILNLRFSPTEQREYADYLTIESNAYNGTIELQLLGQGGDQVFNGPRLELSELPIDFGTVPYGLYVDKNIPISNIGNIAMVVGTITLEDDADGRFTFPETVKVPITVPAGEKQYIRVRFTSFDEEAGSFTGKLKVTSNALNNGGEGEVDFKAKTTGVTADKKVSLSEVSLDFGEIDINTSSEKTLTITNIGSTNLTIFSVTFDKASGGENIAQFKFLDGTEKNIPQIEPGESHDIKIQFAPENPKDYAVLIKMLTNDNAVNGGVVEVPLSGKGHDPASVKEPFAEIKDLSVRISPNPLFENGTIELNVQKAGNIEMYVVDYNGKRILDVYNAYTSEGLLMKELNSANISSGMYFLNVNYNGQILNVPFVVSR